MVIRSAYCLAVAAVLVLGLVGCTATAPAAQDSGTDDTSNASTEETPSEPAPSSAAPTLTDAPAAGGPQMSMTAASIDPATLTIAVGDVVTFTSGDDGFHGLVINGLDSVTVAQSLPEYYLFTEAGTYLVSDELSDATATITVE